jgi:hypothetical protein
MESPHAEVAPFGITTTIVNPGFFRTELLTEQSTNYAEPSIEDYDERRAKQLEFWKSQNGQQSGDPVKLARALIMIASQQPPPRRFIAGADAIATAEQTVADLKAQIDADRDLLRLLLTTECPSRGHPPTTPGPAGSDSPVSCRAQPWRQETSPGIQPAPCMPARRR